MQIPKYFHNYSEIGLTGREIKLGGACLLPISIAALISASKDDPLFIITRT